MTFVSREEMLRAVLESIAFSQKQLVGKFTFAKILCTQEKLQKYYAHKKNCKNIMHTRKLHKYNALKKN